jgi:hypothetical protein
MKSLLLASLVIISSLIFSNKLNAQSSKLIEPEFAGAGFILYQDSTTEDLERGKIKATIKTKGLLNPLVSINLETDGCCSTTKIENTNTPIKLVIKSLDNNSDPTNIYKVLKFEKDKKGNRIATISQSNLLSSSLKAEQKLDEQLFSGKKFGNSSYILSLTITKPGEYVIVESKTGYEIMINTGLFFTVK